MLTYLKGSQSGFGETLFACHAPLYRYARSLTRDPSMAEELVQETYRKALAAPSKPVPATEENTRAWTFTILRNLWHNEIRRRNRWASGKINIEELPLSAEPLETSVARTLLQSEVRDAIDSLSEPFREIVLLRDIEGLSYADIAQILGCPSGTVMSRLARAREALRRVLCSRPSAPREVKQ